jgi:ADP-ribosylglycohydrolase
MKRFTVLSNYSKDKFIDILHYKIKELDFSIGCFYGLVIGNVCCSPYDTNIIRDHNSTITDISSNYKLRLGQYSSAGCMALCISESLLSFKIFNELDIRKRFHYWWYSSYCNPLESNQISSNIDTTLMNSIFQFENKQQPYCIPDNSHSSSSLVRLAPIVIFWRNNPENVIMISQLQNYITHGSEISGVLCALLSFILVKLITLDISIKRTSDGLKSMLNILLLEWLDIYETQLIIHPYRNNDKPGDIIEATDIMIQICQSTPIENINNNWNWKQDYIDYDKIIEDRNISANTQKYTQNSFGVYSPDALSLAFHIIYHSDNFSDVIYKTSIIGGNSSNIGSIACQIAGSYYGYDTIIQENSVSKWNNLLLQFDDNRTILNSILLYLSNS